MKQTAKVPVERKSTILVGSDFSKPARTALLQALSLARTSETHLTVLHVIHAPEIEELSRLAEVPERVLRERLGRERRERLVELVREVDERPGDVRSKSHSPGVVRTRRS